jgi:Uncharacterised nucleotidyltransferase
MICQEASIEGFLTVQSLCAPQNLVSDYCPEIEIVLSCARTKLEPRSIERVKRLIQEDIDWTKLIQYANKHGVTQLLYHNFRQVDLENLPKKISDYLRCFCHANTLRNVRLNHELVALVKLFTSQGIAVVPFKGPVLSCLAYGNLALRQFGDLDLLVQSHDVKKAFALLMAQGYQLGNLTKVQKKDLDFHGGEIVLIHQVSQTVIDLHWEIAPKFFPFEVSLEDWWSRLQPVFLNQVQVLTFCPEDTLLHLCVHAANHLWTRLEWLCDIAELIRTHGAQINWSKVLKEAHRVGCDRILLLNCCLVRDLLDSDLPSAITQKIALDPTLPSLAKVVKTFIFSPPQEPQPFDRMEGLLLFVRMRERPLHQLMHLMYVMHRSKWATPSLKDREVLPLPSQLAFLYWFIRPIRILRRYRVARRQFVVS